MSHNEHYNYTDSAQWPPAPRRMPEPTTEQWPKPAFPSSLLVQTTTTISDIQSSGLRLMRDDLTATGRTARTPRPARCTSTRTRAKALCVAIANYHTSKRTTYGATALPLCCGFRWCPKPESNCSYYQTSGHKKLLHLLPCCLVGHLTPPVIYS